MDRDIKASEFATGELVYVFEQGPGKFIANLGFDEEWEEEMLQVEGTIDGRARTTCCFTYGSNHEVFRFYSLGKASVKIVYCDDYEVRPVKILYQGPEVLVRYSDEEGERETFKDGDELHKDWDGRGIEFDVLVDKWLRRLNGEIIPLSDYFKDSYNRYLDTI